MKDRVHIHLILVADLYYIGFIASICFICVYIGFYGVYGIKERIIFFTNKCTIKVIVLAYSIAVNCNILNHNPCIRPDSYPAQLTDSYKALMNVSDVYTGLGQITLKSSH